MMTDKMRRSGDGVGVEIPSLGLVDRKDSVKTASLQPCPCTIRNDITDHDDQAAQRGDEECVALSQTTQYKDDLVLSGTKRDTKPNRRHRCIFDVLTKVNLNTSLTHPGRSEMRFGDLDFNFDISGEWVEDVEEECATESSKYVANVTLR